MFSYKIEVNKIVFMFFSVYLYFCLFFDLQQDNNLTG